MTRDEAIIVMVEINLQPVSYTHLLLIKYGGHLGAGGFSIETSKIEDFNKRIQEFAEINFRMMPVPDITADKLILPDEINVNTVSYTHLSDPHFPTCGEVW